MKKFLKNLFAGIIFSIGIGGVFALNYIWTSFYKVGSPITLPATQFISGGIVSGNYTSGGTMLMQVGESGSIYTYVPLLDGSGNNYITGGGQYWTKFGANIYNNNTGSVGINTNTPTGLLDVQNSSSRYVRVNANGTLTSNFSDNAGAINQIAISNIYGTTGVTNGILFNAGDGATSYNQNRIVAGQETLWTSTASTRNSYMGFQTSAAGSMGEKMRISSNGLVGIGTNSPTNKLDVVNNANSNTTINVANSDTTNASSRASFVATNSGVSTAIQSIGNQNNGYVGTFTNHNLNFVINGNSKMYLTTGGSLGLGVSSTPTTTLDVGGTTKLGNGSRPSTTFTQTNSRLSLVSSTEDQYLINGNMQDGIGIDRGGYLFMGARRTSGTNNMTYSWIKGARNNAVDASASTYLDFGVNSDTSAPGMRLDVNNMLGVGTTGASARITASNANTGSAVMRLQTIMPTVYPYTDLDFYNENTAGGSTVSKIRSNEIDYQNSDLQFWTEGANSPTQKMTLTPTGNLGIGTTAPTTKLQVNGDVIFGNYLSGSYTKIDGSGFIQSYGDAIVWNDIVGENYYGSVTLRQPVLLAMNGGSIMTQCFDDDGITEIFGRFEKPHNATDTGWISPHLHWMGDVTSATTTGVIFYTYSFIEPGKLPTPEITITGYMANGIVSWSGRVDEIDGDIYDSGVVLGGSMMYRVWRDASIAEDTYAGNMCIQQIGLHYRTDRRGSRQERVR